MKKTLLLLFFLGFVVGIKAQYFCSTIDSNYRNIIPQRCRASVQFDGPYYVRVYFHIIRMSDSTGTNSFQVTWIPQCLQVLNEDFGPLHISFEYLGMDYIDSTRFYNINDFQEESTKYYSLINTNTHPHAINVYLLPINKNIEGLANSLPGTALAVKGISCFTTSDSLHVISHEMGHCLGLFHTFHGTLYGEGGCPELVDGSNCDICGDFVCDTPADPVYLSNYADNNCIWINTTLRDSNYDLYNPDTRQIMAYVKPSCMEHFSTGQGVRARTHLATQAILQERSITSMVYVQNEEFRHNNSGLISAFDTIFVGRNITSDNIGNVIVKDGANMEFIAGGKIRIESGFRVEKGATYHASINPSITSPSSSAPERNSGKGSTRQDYLPMLKSTSWTSIEKSLEDITATIYYQVGDTMIGSNKYIKTKYTGVNLSNNVVWHDPWDRVELYREDSSTKRVYLRDAYDNTDILLFDFSLQIGDTLPFWPYYPLTEISTISNSGQTRRKFVFTNSTDTIVWVEGVGNYVKPFSPTAFLNHIYSSRVLCVKMGDDVVYDTEPFMNTYTCSNVSEAAEQHMANEQIVSSNGYVYPTVTASFIHLIGYDALQSVYIYNLSGQLVLQTTETDIDVSALPAGVYVVHARTANNQLLTTKFVHL